ncbi:MalY/PatB family protein [Mycoplasma sp. P36-A1]|uniref:MalY/PatB family protein n=1 Tax=Mycoplasma sp. P36-A1 TaxID=3252900 RepID=UPI003C2B5F83
MKYDFDKVIDRHNTYSTKWDFMNTLDQRAEKDTLPMWIADMDFEIASPISNAIKDYLKLNLLGYSMPTDRLNEAILTYYKRRFDWDILKDSICFSPAILPAISNLIQLLTDEQEGVIIQSPVYTPFFNLIKGNNRVVANNKLILKDGSYQMDLVDLRKLASKGENKVILLCSPHNPVGRVWSKDDLAEVIRIARVTNTYLIVDEIHCDLIRENEKHNPIFNVVKHQDRNQIISLISPSKSFNIPGLSTAFAIIEDEKLRNRFNTMNKMSKGLGGMQPLSIVGTIAAYEQGDEWLNQLLVYLDENFKMFKEEIEKALPKAKINIAQGTYLGWLDLSAYGSNEVVLEKLIEKGKILLQDGTLFGLGGEGYFRINLATSKTTIKESIYRITKALK